MPRDHHPLAFEGAVNQLRQLVLGLCNAMGAHKSNIAIGWPFCPVRVSGAMKNSSGSFALIPIGWLTNKRGAI